MFRRSFLELKILHAVKPQLTARASQTPAPPPFLFILRDTEPSQSLKRLVWIQEVTLTQETRNFSQMAHRFLRLRTVEREIELQRRKKQKHLAFRSRGLYVCM